jgi:divalent metal cation (Fe/Co/Zn/Cd) transporter
LLAPYVGFESVQALVNGERPDVSYLGIALAATSLVVMPVLGTVKQRIGQEMGLDGHAG